MLHDGRRIAYSKYTPGDHYGCLALAICGHPGGRLGTSALPPETGCGGHSPGMSENDSLRAMTP